MCCPHTQVIYMGYIEHPEAMEMVEYYFGAELSPSQQRILRDLLVKGHTEAQLPEPSERGLAVRVDSNPDYGLNVSTWGI